MTKARKLHTIGDTLISVEIKITEILQGKKYEDELKSLSLSNDTLSKRIRKICDDMHEQLLESERAPSLQFNAKNQPTFTIYDSVLLCMILI
jgi:hypothetical protein